MCSMYTEVREVKLGNDDEWSGWRSFNSMAQIMNDPQYSHETANNFTP